MLLSLRIGTYDHFHLDFIDNLISELKAYGHPFDEVWLASSYGLLTVEQCRAWADQMGVAARKFENEGIYASMQISRTMGHGEDGLLMHGGDGVKDLDLHPITGIDGYRTTGKFCWNDENFRKYIAETTRQYVSFKPRIVWIDDDLRIRFLAKGGRHLCFCDNCIRLFNEKYGYHYTRERLREDFLYDSASVRREYVSFQTESLGSFARMLAKAIHEASPDTIVALQNGGETMLAINAQKACLDAMYEESGYAPAFRAGGGLYDDHAPHFMLDKMATIHYMNSRLPKYVAMRSCEIENIPFVAYGKSNECSCIEAAMYIAYGCNMASICIRNQNEPLSYHAELFEKLTHYKPYLARMVHCNEGTDNTGLCVYQPRASHLEYRKRGSEHAWAATSYNEGKNLMRQGIPVHFGPYGDVYLLSSKACDYLGAEDVEMLLKSPVLTDAASLEKLFQMGYADQIKAGVQKLDEKYMNTFYEKTLPHTVNEGICLEQWNDFRTYVNDSKYVITGNEIESLAEYYTYVTHECAGCAFAIVETAYGAKWAVRGAHLLNAAVSHARRNQTLNAIHYISRQKLAAYVETPHQTVIVPRINDKGETVTVTLLNISITDSENMQIVIDKPANTKECIIIDPYADEIRVNVKEMNGKYTAKVGTLAPWRVKSLVFEKKECSTQREKGSV